MSDRLSLPGVAVKTIDTEIMAEIVETSNMMPPLKVGIDRNTVQVQKYVLFDLADTMSRYAGLTSPSNACFTGG